jgi:hypothetical protein
MHAIKALPCTSIRDQFMIFQEQIVHHHFFFFSTESKCEFASSKKRHVLPPTVVFHNSFHLVRNGCRQMTTAFGWPSLLYALP